MAMIQITDSIPRLPPQQLTAPKKNWLIFPGLAFVYTWAYILVRSIISGAISGAINYGIAVIMYGNSNTAAPHAYKFPSTILGDFIVTLLVQGLILWFTTVAGVFLDLRTGLALAYVISENSASNIKLIQQKFTSANSEVGNTVTQSTGTTATTTTIITQKRQSFISLDYIVAFWIPDSRNLAIFVPIPPKSTLPTPLPFPLSHRLQTNAKLAATSATFSVLLYMPVTLAIVYGCYGVGDYARVVAVDVKAVFSACAGFFSSV
ncbi:hypothetical protein HK100_004867, partial [Physocladia obscura]